VQGRLLDRTVAFRSLGLIGPIEAILAMTAFVASMVAGGWRPGEPFPAGEHLLAASGAAFSTVVLGQMANAFACRSDTLPAWRNRLRSNRFLAGAVAVELVALLVALFWDPLASLLGQSSPPSAGWVVAVSAVPAVLLADGLFKRIRGGRDDRQESGADARWPTDDDPGSGFPAPS
jgi:magnesium-transporting ATPase (P-type)